VTSQMPAQYASIRSEVVGELVAGDAKLGQCLSILGQNLGQRFRLAKKSTF
jgi:hypothetical protein